MIKNNKYRRVGFWWSVWAFILGGVFALANLHKASIIKQDNVYY